MRTKSSSVKRPVVVVVHGVDGMASESGAEIRRFADQIAGQGFLVFTPHYFDANDGSDTLSTLLAPRLQEIGAIPRLHCRTNQQESRPGVSITHSALA